MMEHIEKEKKKKKKRSVTAGDLDNMPGDTLVMSTKKPKKKKRTSEDEGSASVLSKKLRCDDDVEKEIQLEEKTKKKKKKKKDKENVTDDSQVTDVAEDASPEDMPNSEETLSAELIEMKRKKKEKMKLKKEAKKEQKEKQKAKLPGSPSGGGEAKEAALTYLHCWNDDRAAWKFNKKRQIWLLTNMYNLDWVSDSDFSIILEYMEPLKGMARDLTVQKAQQLLDSAEESSGGEEEESSEEEEEKKKKKEAKDKNKENLTEHQLARLRLVIQAIG